MMIKTSFPFISFMTRSISNIGFPKFFNGSVFLFSCNFFWMNAVFRWPIWCCNQIRYCNMLKYSWWRNTAWESLWENIEIRVAFIEKQQMGAAWKVCCLIWGDFRFNLHCLGNFHQKSKMRWQLPNQFLMGVLPTVTSSLHLCVYLSSSRICSGNFASSGKMSVKSR